MISASDVPACPACGCRDVHPISRVGSGTFYACRQCGRDVTDAWVDVQPAPPPAPVIGPPDPEPTGSST
jgi:ribosomal protein L37AE/L43A